jgi:hypothetical protein
MYVKNPAAVTYDGGPSARDLSDRSAPHSPTYHSARPSIADGLNENNGAMPEEDVWTGMMGNEVYRSDR